MRRAEKPSIWRDTKINETRWKRTHFKEKYGREDAKRFFYDRGVWRKRWQRIMSIKGHIPRKNTERENTERGKTLKEGKMKEGKMKEKTLAEDCADKWKILTSFASFPPQSLQNSTRKPPATNTDCALSFTSSPVKNLCKKSPKVSKHSTLDHCRVLCLALSFIFKQLLCAWRTVKRHHDQVAFHRHTLKHRSDQARPDDFFLGQIWSLVIKNSRRHSWRIC